MTRSILVPIFSKRGMRYDIRTDSMCLGKFHFCLRVRLGWPCIRWGWVLR